MSVRMRINRSATRNRRSHDSLGNLAIVRQKDGSMSRRHRVSPVTGTYKGRRVVEIKEKISKREEKEKGKSAKAKSEKEEAKENK